MNNNDRGFVQIPFIIHIPSQQMQQEDLIMDQLLAGGCDLTPNKLASKRSREILTIGDEEGRSNSNQTKQKRAMHRDIERLRRQEMAKQYASLRSLLPPEYIKGKCSISDHVHETVSYINDLQGKIKELDVKREKLNKKKNLSADHTSAVVVEPAGRGKGNSTGIGCEGNSATVTFGSCSCGVEILINTSSSIEGGRKFPLSKMVKALDKQNLSVVSCISAKVNQRLLYTIQCEASDPTSIVLSALQLMLMDVINTIFG